MCFCHDAPHHSNDHDTGDGAILLYRPDRFPGSSDRESLLRSVVYCRFNLAAIRDVPLSASEDKCFKSLSAADGDPRLSIASKMLTSKCNTTITHRHPPLVSDGTNMSHLEIRRHYADRSQHFTISRRIAKDSGQQCDLEESKAHVLNHWNTRCSSAQFWAVFLWKRVQ